MDEVKEDGWSLHDELFHEFYCSEFFASDKIVNILTEAYSTYEGHEVHIDFGGVTRENFFI